MATALCVLAITGSLVAGCELAIGPEQRLARAERSVAAGDLRAAAIDIRKVLQKEPQNSRAWLLLAKVEFRLGDVASAAWDIAKVESAAVRAEDYETLRWRMQLAQRKFREVADALRAPRQGLPESERQYILGSAYLALGELAGAREALQAAVALDPASGPSRASYALALASGGDLVGAQSTLDAAARDLPQSADVARARGGLYLRASRLADAEVEFRRALALSSPRSDLPGYSAAAAGLGESLLGQGHIDAAAALVGELGRNAPDAGVTLLLRGRVAAAQRDYPTALANLQRVLNVDPDNVWLRTLVGAVHFEQGSLEQAAMQLQRVVSAKPDYVPAARLLAQVMMAQGRSEDAARIFAEIGAETNGNPDVLLIQARVALAAGRNADAVKMLNELEKHGGYSEAVRLELASAYIQAGDAGRAFKLLGEERSSDSDRVRRLRLLALAAQDRIAGIRELNAYAAQSARQTGQISFAALALAALGQIDQARSLLETASAAHPKDALLNVNLARVLVRAGRLDEATQALQRAAKIAPSADTYVSIAQIAAMRAQDDEAIRWLEMARRTDSKAVTARLLLARGYLMAHRDDAAWAVAEELLALAGTQPEVHLLAAAVAADRKDRTRAEQQIAEAVRAAPDSAQVWLGKGEVHERLEDLEAAREAYRHAESIAPHSVQPLVALARLDLRAGNPDGALAAARRAEQRPEILAAGLRLEGGILLQMNRPAEAAHAFEQLMATQPGSEAAILLYEARRQARASAPEAVLLDWLKAHPQDAAVRQMVAQHWEQSGEPARAIAAYEELLRLRPDQPILLNNLAWAYAQRHDPRALDTARHAYQLAPGNAAIADTLGTILVDRNQWDEGLSLLREAARGAPLAAEIQYHLADALMRSGQKAEAMSIVNRARQQGGLRPEDEARFAALLKRSP